MDYEKAYKAALKTATQWIKDGCTDKEKICLECVLPELRESEDERIRRTLVEYFGPPAQLDFIRGVPIQKIRDWLEKQKEQKPVEIKVVYPNNPKRKEIGFYYNKKEVSWDDMLLADRMHDYPYYFHDGMDYYPFMPEQKPIKWSEEDERILYNVIAYVGYAAGERGVKDDDFKEANEWLRNLRSHPSWKPSEEQMDALKELIDDANRAGWVTPGATELYEQLKKL